MTGPEHYRAAEQLLAAADTVVRPNDEGHCEADRMIAAAQVHATLALAAAQAGVLTDKYVGDTNLITAWSKTTGTLPETYDAKGATS